MKTEHFLYDQRAVKKFIGLIATLCSVYELKLQCLKYFLLADTLYSPPLLVEVCSSDPLELFTCTILWFQLHSSVINVLLISVTVTSLHGTSR